MIIGLIIIQKILLDCKAVSVPDRIGNIKCGVAITGSQPVYDTLVDGIDFLRSKAFITQYIFKLRLCLPILSDCNLP